MDIFSKIDFCRLILGTSMKFYLDSLWSNGYLFNSHLKNKTFNKLQIGAVIWILIYLVIKRATTLIKNMFTYEH